MDRNRTIKQIDNLLPHLSNGHLRTALIYCAQALKEELEKDIPGLNANNTVVATMNKNID